MSADALLSTWIRPARRRRLTNDALLALPIIIMTTAVIGRAVGITAAFIILLIGSGIAFAMLRERARQFDQPWLVRNLNDARADMEDSTELLFTESQSLNVLQRLQQSRLNERLGTGVPEALAADWSRRALAICWVSAIVVTVVAIAWPRGDMHPVILAPSAEGIAPAPGIPRLVQQNLRVIPPAYTGLPMRDEAKLDTRAPQGSRLEWTLRFDPQADIPTIMVLGSDRLALRRDGANWIASRILDRPFLYRVVPASARGAMPPLHRIDAVADAPPQIKALSPTSSLSIVTASQRGWTPVFSATDDYGVAAMARLRITLAVGEGENVTFREREIAVTGTGPARDRRFAPRLDFGTLGFSPGGDLVVQLIVRDNRSPTAQSVRGPSLILRWPSAKAPESGGLQGMVNTTLPAYFRSQRQIIIDAETLLKQKSRLASDRYLARSNSIGGDQEILRGRYSQFLGGESEGQPQAPTSDAASGYQTGSTDEDHGSALQPAVQGFGAPEDVLAEFGHPHDDSQASSLDPETRAILKNAVDEMWQSELQLKQGRPDLALPYANRALRFIKDVQQATRIFLSRTGTQLPPIDQSRRMTGKREGLASRELAVAPVESADGPAAAAWRALGEGPGAIRGPISLDALDGWIRNNGHRLPDALALAGALDSVRQQPSCRGCRQRLRALLWTAMERPPANIARRRPPDAGGARYLGAISGGGR